MTKVDVATRCRLMGFIAGAISGAVVGTLLFTLVGTVIAMAGVGWVAFRQRATAVPAEQHDLVRM